MKNIRKSHIPFRLNFLYFLIFILFVALISRLGVLQLASNDKYTSKINALSTIEVSESAPRGNIYDSQKKLLATNNASPAITFTRGVNMSAQEILSLATKLSQYMDMPIDENLTDRDKRDFYLADQAHLKQIQSQLTKKEKEWDNSKQYARMVELVPADQLNFDENQLKLATIFKQMNAAQSLSTVYVKNEGVTDQELAVISEHASELPGISTGTDWNREILANNSLKSLIGKVSTEKQGLPAEEVEEYLKKGYARNDRVGTSFIEKSYETYLQGKKSKYEISVDGKGNITSKKEIASGSKGDNVVLSINSEFQAKVDEILKRNYQSLIDNGFANYSPGIYAVVMNPNTGGILAMSGYYHEIGASTIEENALGTYMNAFVPGSVVKAGTLTAGWQKGVISGNQTFLDEPIYIQGTAPKTSIFNRSGYANMNLTAEKALEISSNSYMMKIALKLMGIEYQRNISLPLIKNQASAYEALRNAFAEYGMGVKTGIDLPKESSGIQPSLDQLSEKDNDGGKILDLAFGQFDTYTTMQLAQYVATVANGGNRIEPHIVEAIYGNNEEGEIGEKIKDIQGKVLNKVDISKEDMAIIHRGFYDAVHGSNPFTTATLLQSAKMDLSAKTGTAETTVTDNGKLIEVVNLNVVVYGPSDDAQVCLAIMIPQIDQKAGHPNLTVAKEIIDAYVDTYTKN